MARKLHIGFDQGPPTLVAQTGKYGLLRPLVSFSTSGAAARRYAPGHYIAFNTPLGAGGIPNGGTVSGAPYPNATVTGATPSNAGPAVRSSTDGRTGALVTAGFSSRFYWSDIETSQGVYNFSKPDTQLAQARALGVPILFIIVERTFTGSIAGTFTGSVRGTATGTLNGATEGNVAPGTYGVTFGSIGGTGVFTSNGDVRSNVVVAGPVGARTATWTGNITSGSGAVTSGIFNLMSGLQVPTYLKTFAEPFFQNISPSVPGGWQMWIWSPTVRSAYNNLAAAFGARYNADIYFAGMGIQETAMNSPQGGSSTIYTVNGYQGSDNYSSTAGLTGFENMASSIANASQSGGIFCFQNFLAGNNSLLDNYGAFVQPLGAWFGGPDLVTGLGNSGNSNANIVANCYPRENLYHNGTNPMPGSGPTFESVQNGEWTGTGVGDGPPNPNTPNLANLFNYGTSSFLCKPANGFTGALDWSPGNSGGRSSPLNLDAIFWDYGHNSGAQTFAGNLVPIMKAFPTFGTWSP